MITYPRNVDARYTVWSVSEAEAVKENVVYPRADGGTITGLDADLVLLEQIRVTPDYDEQTEILGEWSEPVVDLDAGTITQTRSVLPKPPPTLKEQLDGAWAQLPVAVQLQFDPLRPLVRIYLEEDRPEMLRALIDSQVVPTELEQAKADLLALIDAHIAE